MTASPNSTDRRVLRTRCALHEALVSLMVEHGWDDLSVQDICERANVGRSTFYLHYQGKEELLSNSLDNLRKELQAQARVTKIGNGNSLQFVRGLIEHACEQRLLFRSIIGRRSGYVVHMRFRKMVIQLVKDDLPLRIGKNWQRQAAVRYISGALVEMLAWWVDANTPCSAMELEEYFFRMTLPLVEQLCLLEVNSQ